MQVSREPMKPQDFAQSFFNAACKRQNAKGELMVGPNGIVFSAVDKDKRRMKLYEEVLNKLIFGEYVIRKVRAVYNAVDDDFVKCSDRISDFFEFSQWLNDMEWRFMSGKRNPHCHPLLKPIGDKPPMFIFSSGNVQNSFIIEEK